ncbi:MAG: DEAD/DEAH box helicase [Promethearchaeota archaeon]
MKAANQIIDDTLNRITELIWWNRGLSKLSNEFLFKNYEDFIKNELIERKGVFIEYIKPPIFDDLGFRERANDLKLDLITINTVLSVFGKKEFKLYLHQAESLKKIITDKEKDLILAVPTATGKTEAFFIPILDYCIKNSEERGLKAIIIYPTKTLEVDQFNRFIEFLYYANRILNDKKRKTIKIGIWDGDTPPSVGDPNIVPGAIEPGIPLRGILCPICKKKLILNKKGVLRCEKHDEFYFINAIRNRIIKTGTDILITNPEALDFLMNSPIEEKLTVLGKKKSEYPLKYIVYDEGHIWRGLSGTSISLLSKRLRYFYQKNNPQFMIVSATIADPKQLAVNLLNIPEDKVNVVQYYGKKPKISEITEPLDFTRWKYCDFSEMICILLLIDLYSDLIEDLKLEQNIVSNLDNILHNLNLLGLAEINNNNVKITDFGRPLLNLIKDLMNIKIREDINKENISDKLSSSLEFSKQFSEILLQKMKEIFKIIEFFDSDDKKPITFIKLEDLIKKLSQISNNSMTKKEWEKNIEMYLNFGQFANLLINRYHFFLKSPDRVYWCFKCKKLTLRRTCEQCENKTMEIRFCRVCHHPYMGIGIYQNKEQIQEMINKAFNKYYTLKNLRELDPNIQIELSEDEADYFFENFERIAIDTNEAEEIEGEVIFEPIGYSSSTNYCPNCNRYMPRNQLYTGGVYFTTFVSFILSALPRLNNSHKVLVFSDSRRNAENIGSEMMDMDYEITASRAFVNYLSKENDFSKVYINNTPKDLWHIIRDKLKEEFYFVLANKVKDRKGFIILNEVLNQKIYPKSYLNQNRHLFSEAILIVKELYEKAENTKEIIIGQELFRIYFFESALGFQFKNFSFKQTSEKHGAYTFSKLIDKIARRIEFLGKKDINQYLPKILKIFIDTKIIEIFSSKEEKNTLEIEELRLRNLLGRNGKKKYSDKIVDENLSEVKSFLNDQKNQLNRILNANYETGLIRRHESIFETNFSLLLLRSIYFCTNCYSIFPYKFDDLDKCLVCKNKLIKHNRIELKNGELKFNEIKGNLYNIDHWGEELIKYGIREDFNDQIIKIGIHRAGLPYTIRGAIEESFRNGEINIVSATPTMELGIDIGKLNCALQLGIPPSLANYVQRCGRTGRNLSTTSLIFTIIRNENAIDEYYFEHLDDFFSKLDRISIPHYETINFIYAGHILTFILSYLARNKTFSEEYLNVFDLNSVYDDAKSYAVDVLGKIAKLRSVILKRQDELKEELIDCFGESSTEIFDKLFSKDDEISLWKKSSDFFGKIREFGKGYGIQNLSEMYTNIILWGNLLGFIANYRGFGENIPISLESGHQVQNIDITEIKRVIRENFPGEKNNKGAIFRYAGARYVVDKVWGSGKIGELKVCPDIEGNHPFIAINTDEKKCPFCETELRKMNVYKIKKIIAKPARGMRYNYKTMPYLSNNVEIKGDRREKTDIEIFNLACKLFKGKFNHIEFSPAYLRRYLYQRNYTFHTSQAKIEDIIQKDFDISDPDSFLTKEPKKEKLSPIGNKIESFGLCLIFDFDKIIQKIEIESSIAFLISFNQILKRTVSIISDCELDDFELFWIYDHKKIHYYLLEGLGGTQGISDTVYFELCKPTNNKFLKLLKEFINCRKCGSKSNFCSSCLLLRRTPEFYISKNLLNKNLLKQVLLD